MRGCGGGGAACHLAKGPSAERLADAVLARVLLGGNRRAGAHVPAPQVVRRHVRGHGVAQSHEQIIQRVVGSQDACRHLCARACAAHVQLERARGRGGVLCRLEHRHVYQIYMPLVGFPTPSEEL